MRRKRARHFYDFTKGKPLPSFLDAGVDVGMVQVGNEINNGMAGEEDVDTVMDLIASGSRAVREIANDYGKDIKVAVHYTNIEDYEEVDTMAANLQNAGVDYDLFGLSYYPYWDGTMENMQAVAENIENTYGKDVYIAETSYCYTTEDGDGFANSFAGTGGSGGRICGDGAEPGDDDPRHLCSGGRGGSARCLLLGRHLIPVGDADADNTAPLEKNTGSGWASSYSADYDPEDAGLYYGGCSWDNQAMFDFTGHPLASLNVFKYLKYGCDGAACRRFYSGGCGNLRCGR